MESTDSSTGSQQQPQLPPGFRFHPTDEELVVHYLKKKVASIPIPVPIIAEVDLYKFDPWELPSKASFGEQEWYFFSPRDRKYPNGARPNRAATSGYWKATGTDKPVLTAGGTQKVGVKKALVYYGGKPPKGIKTNWIMHEYRLTDNKPNPKPPGCDIVGNKKGSLRLDDWVLCRIYKKNNAQRPMDQERDHHQDLNDMIGSIQQTMAMPIGPNKLLKSSGYGGMIENDANIYEVVMCNEAMKAQQQQQQQQLTLMSASHHHHHHQPQHHEPDLMMSGKRTLPSLYWNHHEEAGNNVNSSPPTKRFMSENCENSIVSMREDQAGNSITTMLNQLPQANSMQQQAMLGNIGDGVFRQQQQQQPYGMNWYT